jgi:hypothetical protein
VCCDSNQGDFDWEKERKQNRDDFAQGRQQLTKNLRDAQASKVRGALTKKLTRTSIGRAVKRAIDQHHSWPMYLTGPIKQALVKLRRTVHQTFHMGLDRLLPRQLGKAFYASLRGKARKEMLRKLLDYTRGFDKKFGTKITRALKKTLEKAGEKLK